MLRFIRTWMLAIGILLGTLFAMLFVWIPSIQPFEAESYRIIKAIQPWFIFSMLFITFCKVNLSDMRIQRWHIFGLLLQAGIFALLALLLIFVPDISDIPGWRASRPIIEGIMLCLICPTATAAVVVTGKLGGNISGITTYTILINLVVALIIPTFVPLMNPDSSLSFLSSFLLIISKVFPLLFCPFLLALFVRRYAKRLRNTIIGIKDLALYIWAVSLTFAIMVSVKSIYESDAPLWVMGGIAFTTFLACVLQFWSGRRLGHPSGDLVTPGQALGQKNTVFLIWCGYTFFDPLSSIAGGFYSVFHNVWNSYQLAQVQKQKK